MKVVRTGFLHSILLNFSAWLVRVGRFFAINPKTIIKMKVQGRITALLQERSGISQRTGQEWRSQPFIIEFFDDGNQRYADRMLLETFDTNHMDTLRHAYASGKEVQMTVGHNVRTLDDGRQFNELRPYNIALANGETIPAQPAAPAAPAASTQPAAQAPVDAAPADKLPF